MKNIFHNPFMPVLEDYYEPWTYKYEDLFTAPAGDDQPTARAHLAGHWKAHGCEGRPELGR
jgi:nitrate reductase beta subunit